MKLIIAIVQDEDSNLLIDDLLEENFRVTKLASTGGFLKNGNTTLLMGIEEDEIERVLSIIKKNCKKREITSTLMNLTMQGENYTPYPVEVTVGGANIFILDVYEYINY